MAVSNLNTSHIFSSLLLQLVEMFENISGSADLKEEYDAALKAKEEAEQRTIFAFNKTKEHKSERRQLKEQKVC